MADKPTTNTSAGRQTIAKDGAIPRMGMSIPTPANTKPPAPSQPAASSDQK